KTSTRAETALKSWKYVDVNSFFRLLLNDSFYLRWGLIAATFLIVLPLLFSAWRNADRKNEADQWLIWAATVAWTPVLNLYFGIYDATLVVFSALLTTGALYYLASQARPKLTPGYRLTLLLLYLTPWITQPIARITGFQIYTVVLAAFGFYLVGQLST